MDQERLQELVRKRDAEGLTDDEANELGKLLADQAGEPYANAETAQGDEELRPAAWENPRLEEEGPGELDQQGPSQEPDKEDASELGAAGQKGSLPGPGPQPTDRP